MSSITFGPNRGALAAQSSLRRNSSELGDTMQRLSSGLRVNDASDGGADLQLAQSLRTTAAVHRVGARNVSDGISLFTIAEAGLQGLQDIVTRQMELAQQAANGALSSTQREALDEEAGALVEEFNRIVADTEYNSRKLLDGSTTSISIQAGYSSILFPMMEDFAHTIYSTGSPAEATGDFLARTTYPSVPSPNFAESGDFNGDGNLDVAIADNALYIMLGNGDGSFKVMLSYSSFGGDISHIAVGDFNNDGRDDIVANDGLSTPQLYFANADGSFAEAQFFADSPMSTSPSQVADYNNDGKLDVYDGSGGLYLGNGNGTFDARYAFTTNGGFVGYTSDVNGDGKLDLVNTVVTNFEVLLGNGDGTFNAGIANPQGSIIIGRSIATDLNGDGKADLILAPTTTATLAVLIGNGDGTFNHRTYYSFGVIGNSSFDLADIDDDGKLDVIGSAGQVAFSNGDGTFKAGVDYSASVGAVAVGDFNADGFEDVFQSVGASANSIYLGNSAGTPPVSLGTGYTQGELDLTTQDTAEYAIDILAELSEHIQAELGRTGAHLSRLDFAYNNLVVARANFEAAYSKVVDIDVAEELAKLVRLQVINDAATAILAQANSSSELVLNLIKEIG